MAPGILLLLCGLYFLYKFIWNAFLLCPGEVVSNNGKVLRVAYTHKGTQKEAILPMGTFLGSYLTLAPKDVVLVLPPKENRLVQVFVPRDNQSPHKNKLTLFTAILCFALGILALVSDM